MPDNRLADLEARAERQYQEIRALRRGLGAKDKEVQFRDRLIEKLTEAKREIHAAPAWKVKQPKNGKRHGTVCFLLSDLHLDEVITPESIGNINAFNREIAEQRLTHVFDRAASLPIEFAGRLQFDGCVAFLGGDILTGDIHDELKETNEGTPFESIVHWVPRLAAGIRLLAETYGRVHVPCVDGNHDRNGKQYRFKRRPQSAYSWVLYHWLAEQFAGDSRVTFDIGTGVELSIPVYNTTFLLRHGDGWKGGNGQVGPIGPVRSANLRLMRREMAVGRSYDWLVVGHYHTYVHGLGIIMNGSLKGYDEFANGNIMDFELPQQALWVTTPEHGVTLSMPIICPEGDWNELY